MMILTSACGPANLPLGEDDSRSEELVKDLGPLEGGQVVIPLTNFSTLNPLMTSNSSYHFFSKLIFESLFDFNEDLSLEGKLAESYIIFNEGKTISVKLKNNIRWHDGYPFTSEDVRFTIDVIKYAGRESTYGNILESYLGTNNPINFSSVISTKIIDDRNIEISFDRAYLNNLEVLTFPIIPKHIFEEDASRNSIINALAIEDYIPVGTGPYKFNNYEKDKSVNLTRNGDYWNGSPYIGEIIGRVLDDEELILTAFETGQISFASTIGVDWDKYRQNSRIKVIEYISPNYEFLGFNFNNDLMLGEKGQAIRQAIAYGINRQDIIHKVYLGHGSQVDLPFYPDYYLLSNDAYAYGYNVELSKSILVKAGFTDSDDDGILEDENGRPVSLRLATNVDNPSRRFASELIREYLREIGIEAALDYDNQYTKEIDQGEDESIWEQFNSKITKGDYDMVLLGWQSSVIPNLYPIFHSNGISQATNFINYNNEEMDQLLIELISDNPRDAKINLNENLQAKILKDLPYVSLYYINRGLLVDTKIQGELTPTFFNLYKGIENCYIVE